MRAIAEQATGRVSGIWRYPISSGGGEAVATAGLTASGILDDRNYALVGKATGSPAAPVRELRWRKALHVTASIQAGLPNHRISGRRPPVRRTDR